MSEAEERLRREAGEPVWGVVCYPSGIHNEGFFEIIKDAVFYRDKPWLKASGLTYIEARAMCTLMRAGGNDG